MEIKKKIWSHLSKIVNHVKDMYRIFKYNMGVTNLHKHFFFFKETATFIGRRLLSCPVLTAPHTSGAQQKPYRNCSVNGLVYLGQRCRKAAERKATKDGVGMWTTAM